VRTIVALGGAYLNGTMVAVVLFTNERVPSDRAKKLLPGLHGFKTRRSKP
jgi:hypothetical protein